MSHLTLLHISDLHFGSPYVEEVGESLLQLAHHLSLDAIVVSGDLTHRAKASEFRAASEFLVRLPPCAPLGDSRQPRCALGSSLATADRSAAALSPSHLPRTESRAADPRRRAGRSGLHLAPPRRQRRAGGCLATGSLRASVFRSGRRRRPHRGRSSPFRRRMTS